MSTVLRLQLEEVGSPICSAVSKVYTFDDHLSDEQIEDLFCMLRVCGLQIGKLPPETTSDPALVDAAEQMPEAEPPAAEPPAPPAPPTASVEVEKPPTHADLRQALRAWQTKDPKNSAGEFLKQQGYANVSAIPDDQIAKVLNALKEMP